MLRWLLILTPITAIAGVSGLGELSSQLTTYLILASLPFYAFYLNRPAHIIITEGRAISVYFVILLFLSFLFSANEIIEASGYGRGGVDKFLSSSLVVFFGLYISLLTIYSLIKSTREDKFFFMVAIPVLAGVIINSAVGLFELSALFIPPVKAIYDWFSYNLFHTQGGFLSVGNRLRALGTEPSHLGIFVAFSLPWLMAFRAHRPRLFGVAIVVSISLGFLSTSRTAQLVIIMCLLFYPISKFIVSGGRKKLFAILFLGGVGVSIYSAFAILFGGEQIEQLLIGSESVSNITRSATIYASARLFLDNFLFGAGFGQGSFGVADRFPEWAYMSYEIAAFEADRLGSTAPIFSLPMRLAAETGLAGLLCWYGGMYYIVSQLIVGAKRLEGTLSDDTRRATVAVVMSSFSVIGVGLSVGSLRLVMIWVILGCAMYLRRAFRMELRQVKPTSNAHPFVRARKNYSRPVRGSTTTV